MGWNSQPTAMVLFDDCRIPAENRVGQEGEGFRFAMMGLDGGRLNIASCSLGGAGLALDTARDYALQRKQFGKRLADFQALQFQAGGHGHRTGGRPPDGPRRRRRAGQARPQSHPTLRHGQAPRHRQPGSRWPTRLCNCTARYGYLKDYPA